MLLRCFFIVLSVFCVNCALDSSRTANTSDLVTDDDYYLNYDYDVNASFNTLTDNNNTSDESNDSSQTSNQFKTDSLILPNPETLDSKYTVDALPNIELPDDSLADSDLKDHDFIDNIMYVYYGSGNRNGKHYVSEIIIIGSVLSCAAHLLTLFCVWLKKYYKGRKRTMLYITSNIFGSLFLSNLIFMLGVYATKNHLKCLIIALALNFLYSHTAMWILIYCFYIYRRFCGKWVSVYFKVSHLNILTCGLPLILTLVTYVAIPNSYETKRYCFVSIYRGMILNCLIPISISLAFTTICTINGMININMELNKLDYDSLTESLRAIKSDLEKNDCLSIPESEIGSLIETRNCLKALCLMQLAFNICWFTTPLALEVGQSSKELMYLQLVTSLILNWFIFFKRKTFLPAMEYTLASEKIACEQTDEDTLMSSLTNLDVSSVTSSDNIPLLNSDNATEMKELKRDSSEIVSEPLCETSNISTISS